jgi:hypothetical protein
MEEIVNFVYLLMIFVHLIEIVDVNILGYKDEEIPNYYSLEINHNNNK